VLHLAQEAHFAWGEAGGEREGHRVSLCIADEMVVVAKEVMQCAEKQGILLFFRADAKRRARL